MGSRMQSRVDTMSVTVDNAVVVWPQSRRFERPFARKEYETGPRKQFRVSQSIADIAVRAQSPHTPPELAQRGGTLCILAGSRTGLLPVMPEAG